MVVVIALLIAVFTMVQGLSAFVPCSFDEGMSYRQSMHLVDNAAMQRFFGKAAEEVYDQFERYYIQSLAKLLHPPKNKIPKIIHQIWIGSGDIPSEFKRFQESCQKIHPDWEYHLWTLHNIPTLVLHNKTYIMQSRNPGEISDLLRYEILYQYGGVYLDCDIECLFTLDELHERSDFYIGLQPLDTGYVQLGIGVLGACPGHALLKKLIEGIAQRWHNPACAHMATVRTGPLYVTDVFLEQQDLGTHVVVLPSCYFYPLGSQECTLRLREWQVQGSYTIHHWAKSWLLPEYRRPAFQSIKNT